MGLKVRGKLPHHFQWTVSPCSPLCSKVTQPSGMCSKAAQFGSRRWGGSLRDPGQVRVPSSERYSFTIPNAAADWNPPTSGARVFPSAYQSMNTPHFYLLALSIFRRSKFDERRILPPLILSSGKFLPGSTTALGNLVLVATSLNFSTQSALASFFRASKSPVRVCCG